MKNKNKCHEAYPTKKETHNNVNITTITSGGAQYISKRISNYHRLTLRVFFYSEVVLIYPTNKINFLETVLEFHGNG